MAAPRIAHDLSPCQDIEGLVAELRGLAADYVEMGRQLALAADRIERGDGLAPESPEYVMDSLGNVAQRVLANTLGKGNDRG